MRKWHMSVTHADGGQRHWRFYAMDMFRALDIAKKIIINPAARIEATTFVSIEELGEDADMSCAVQGG